MNQLRVFLNYKDKKWKLIDKENKIFKIKSKAKKTINFLSKEPEFF